MLSDAQVAHKSMHGGSEGQMAYTKDINRVNQYKCECSFIGLFPPC